MQLLERQDWKVAPVMPAGGGPILHWEVSAWAHDGVRVWALASLGIPHPVAEPATAKAKAWPKGLPEGFEGLDVIDLATGVPVLGVISFGESRIVRLKTDADGDFLVDAASGRAIEEKLDGRFRMAG